MASYLPTDPLVLGLLNGLATALGVGLIHGLASGFTPQTLPEPHFLIPNEGIRRSTQRSLLFSLGAALLIVPLSMVQSTLKYTAYFDVPTDLDRQVSTFFLVLTDSMRTTQLLGLLAATLIVTIVFALYGGGLASIQHYFLRLFLWHAGHMPLNYPRFLNHATERILLRQVGGGYVFVHRLVQEYLASLDTPSNTTCEDQRNGNGS